MSDVDYDNAVRHYEQEVERSRHLDNKSNTQIGFIGIILALIGTIYFDLGVGEKQIVNLSIVGAGVGILLVSMGITIIVITPFYKAMPILSVGKFYAAYKGKTDRVKKEFLIKVYISLTNRLVSTNNKKAKMLFFSAALSMIGIAVTFLAFVIKP